MSEQIQSTVQNRMNPRLLAWLYCSTVFLSSAMLLVLEIVAGRMLAPYVGVSLYTWTAIIGVILAGLSLGNWIGGVLADKGHHHLSVAAFLLASALTSALILPLLSQLAALLQGIPMGLASASVFYVTGLFFVPSVIIGVITPLITTLYLGINSKTGKVIGRMHALAAMGSILGTFATGLFLVQWMGTRNIVLLVSAVLFLLSLPFFYLGKERTVGTVSAIAAFLIAVVVSATSLGYRNPCDVESNYYCLRVVDENDPADKLYARTLVLDHMIHSTNVANDPATLVTPYIQVMDALIDEYFPKRESLHYFFGGGGAYTHPRSVSSRFPHAQITVSEIDPAVTAVAVASLFVDANRMEIIHADSRNVLKQFEDAKFDIAITDVFHDVSIPYHLATLEYAGLVKKTLKKDGLYLANVIDVFPENKLILSMVNTLKEVYADVGVWIAPPEENASRLTYVIAASDRSIARESLSMGASGDWYQIAGFIDQQLKKYDAPILSDDYAPVERLLAPLLITPSGA